jgi:2-keto-4-pentenoate hydratase
MQPDSTDDFIANTLVQARRSGQVADATRVAIKDAAQAYRVQALVAQAMGWDDGTPPRHWKAGGPGRDATLTHAPLPPAGVWPSPADASAWPFHWRGIEAEIALRLGQDVDPALAQGLTPEAAPALIDAMAVSIELVDARWAQALQAPALHKLADLQSHGALVLGEWQPLRAVDWATQRCELQIGTALQVFTGTHSLNDPTWLLPQWLRHATRHGAVLPAGTVVTTGTWCGLPLAQAGDAVRVRFEGIGEAQVQL